MISSCIIISKGCKCDGELQLSILISSQTVFPQRISSTHHSHVLYMALRYKTSWLYILINILGEGTSFSKQFSGEKKIWSQTLIFSMTNNAFMTDLVLPPKRFSFSKLRVSTKVTSFKMMHEFWWLQFIIFFS